MPEEKIAMQMKAITIHLPWASLIVIGAKRYETRTLKTLYEEDYPNARN